MTAYISGTNNNPVLFFDKAFSLLYDNAKAKALKPETAMKLTYNISR
jgi:hypothetical protein